MYVTLNENSSKYCYETCYLLSIFLHIFTCSVYKQSLFCLFFLLIRFSFNGFCNKPLLFIMCCTFTSTNIWALPVDITSYNTPHAFCSLFWLTERPMKKFTVSSKLASAIPQPVSAFLRRIWLPDSWSLQELKNKLR